MGIEATSKLAGNVSAGINFVYDKFGNIIGYDTKKEKKDDKIATEMKDIQLQVLSNKEDAFIREASVQEAEKNKTKKTVKDKKSEITNNFKSFNTFMNSFEYFGKDIKNELTIDNENLAREVSDITLLAKKLTSTDISNTTVIESTKKFQAKLQKTKNDIKTHTEKTDSEKREHTFSLETAQDNYDRENKIGVDKAANFFTNNPFMKSAYETTLLNEEKEAV